jgi:hypothetical protein
MHVTANVVKLKCLIRVLKSIAWFFAITQKKHIQCSFYVTIIRIRLNNERCIERFNPYYLKWPETWAIF